MNIATFIGGRTVSLVHSDGTTTDDVLVIHSDGLGIYGNVDGSRTFYPWSTLISSEVTK